MKPDTQHLDYLISQYVDGCLDPASRKSLEQKLVNDPVSRQSYKEQRDVQDVLDDWGNRIPMIDWNAFDKKLATRLQHEVVGGGKVSAFRPWMRPMAAAAALFVAATVGYSWHAFSVGNPVAPSQVATEGTGGAAPSGRVVYESESKANSASFARVHVDDGPGDQSAAGDPKLAVISSPEDLAASKSLSDAVGYGLQMPGVGGSVMPQMHPTSSGTAMGATMGERKDRDDNEAGPGFFPN